jgi:hypothetical protein
MPLEDLDFDAELGESEGELEESEETEAG